VQVQLLGLVILILWALLWSLGLFYILKNINRLKYGEVFEIVGLDQLALYNRADFKAKHGVDKDALERVEQKQRLGQNYSKSQKAKIRSQAKIKESQATINLSQPKITSTNTKSFF